MDRESVISEMEDLKNLTMAAIRRKYDMSYVDFLTKCISDALEFIKQEPKENEGS